MNKTITVIGVAALLATGGCAVFDGTMTEGDVALLAQDLRDVAQAGTVYALAENPQWRTNIILVRDQLQNAATAPSPVTFDSLLGILQQLPVDELKSSEALLAITGARIVLRRAGRNVELGNISNIQPLAGGLAQGMTDGLK